VLRVTDPDKVVEPLTFKVALVVIEPVITALPPILSPLEPDILPTTDN